MLSGLFVCDNYWLLEIHQLAMARSRTASGGERNSPRHTGTGSFKESGMEIILIDIEDNGFHLARRNQPEEIWTEHQEDCEGGGGAEHRSDKQSD